jgi:protein-tyrosine phosphatase
LLFLLPPTSTPEPLPPHHSKNLALDTSSRDSFYSCPDLSTLQITQVPDFDSFDAPQTDISRSPSPSEPAPHPKKRSKAQSVSRKARGVIGKVRALQRIAAAKMAHPSIKIDTSITTTKRGLPENNDAGLDVLGDQDPKLDTGNTDDVPPFLCLSVAGE